MKKIDQKGFSVVEVFIVIVVLGLLGVLGWYIKDSRDSKKVSSPAGSHSIPKKKDSENKEIQIAEEPVPSVDVLGYETSKYKTYSNATHGVSFKYPERWSVREDFQSTTDYISLSMDDEAVPRAGAPTVLTIIITKQKLTADSRKDVYNNNSKDAGYTTKLESGKYFGFSGYKFVHAYKDNIEPEFYYFVLDTPNEPTEIQLNMQRFDYAKDQKTIQLALEILKSAKLGK